jgi:hypothetical protein
MRVTTIDTRTGLRAWAARKCELVSVSWTLHWAESDRVHLAQQADDLPKRLHQMDKDLQALRVRQAVLRSGR